jgi:hypothetical protein
MKTNTINHLSLYVSIFFVNALVNMLASHNLLYAQNPYTHRPRTYIDSVGNYYMHPALGFEIQINTTDGNAAKLSNLQPPSFQNPAKLPETGIYQIKIQKNTTTGAPTTALYEMRADGVPPTSTHAIDKETKNYFDQKNYYYGKNLTVTLQSKDEFVGAKSTYYAINDTNFVPYTQPIVIQNMGKSILYYYAVDKVGNAEKPKSAEFMIDVVPPTTQIITTGKKINNDILGADAALSIEATDELSGVNQVFYTLDGTTFVEYNQQPIAVGALADGTHTLKYYATDKVGNQSITATYNFYIDNVPAYAKYYINGTKYIGDKIYVAANATIAMEATDNKAGVANIAYSIDNSTPRTYTQPFYLDVNKAQQTLTYYATDSVGNASINKYETLNIVVDNQPPIAEILFVGPQMVARDTLFISPKTTILIPAEDALSQIKQVTYSINGSEPQMYKDKFTLKQQGYTNLTINATDNIGNTTTTTKVFYNDDTPPTLNYQLTANILATDTLNGETYLRVPSYCKILLIAIDDKTNAENVTYEIDNQPEQVFKIPIVLPLGLHTISYRAADKTMNISVGELKIRVVEE